MTKRLAVPTRRALLAALSLAPLGACAQILPDPRLPRRRYRDVRIDVAPMVAKGVPNWADRVANALRPAVRAEFADMVDPHDRKAPLLTLEIDAVNFPIYTGGRLDLDPLGAYGADAVTDWIDGWIVDGATRRHVAVTSAAGLAGPWYLADIDQCRLERVARVFAGWARREFEQRPRCAQ
jgi:hypothetical protein